MLVETAASNLSFSVMLSFPTRAYRYKTPYVVSPECMSAIKSRFSLAVILTFLLAINTYSLSVWYFLLHNEHQVY
jgi:hypothetical protein